MFVSTAMTTALAVHAEESRSGTFGFKSIDTSANSTDWVPAAPRKIPENVKHYLLSHEKAH